MNHKRIILYIIFLVLYTSCKSHENGLSECMDESKLQIIESSISILDSEISTLENQSNVNKAYIQFAESWFKNPNNIVENFDSTFIEKLKFEFDKNNLSSEFYQSDNKHSDNKYVVNFHSDYFNCLSKMESKEIQKYIKDLSDSGEYLSPIIIMDEFIKIQSYEEKPTIQMILKIELILRLVK